MGCRSEDTRDVFNTASSESRQRTLASIFMQHRERLRSMVELRLDRRIQPRVDPSDILQEAFLEASRRLEEYCREPPMPVFIWLRKLTAQKLMEIHRHHLETQKRDPRMEVSIERGWGPPSQTGLLAKLILGRGPSPSQAAVQAETRANLEEALDRMEEMDREIVALRHFERLSASEAAEVLGIGREAARKRYLRAMQKLRGILLQMPGAIEGLAP